MPALGIDNGEQTYHALIGAYAEKHRFYHTLEHINACLDHMDHIAGLVDKPDEIELSIWFHDAIYNPYSSKNELMSANWAAHFLRKHSISEDAISRVHNLIMATAHSTPAHTKDESLLVDIDLSILGVDPEVYNRFERAIRKEYKWIPHFLYRKKRGEILESFLNRDKIYQNQYFYQRLEKQARLNLSNAISFLQRNA
jgi:predicted metal-dependent HD superfamily phosphohydrolase